MNTARIAQLLRELADELDGEVGSVAKSERPKRGRRHVQPRRNGSGRISDLAREKARKALGE